MKLKLILDLLLVPCIDQLRGRVRGTQRPERRIDLGRNRVPHIHGMLWMVGSHLVLL